MSIQSQISVIVPVYNAEKYLKYCLESLINQTFKEIEIICVNDGSTDNSLKILEKYSKKDKRIKVFTTENKGQGSARNLGLKKATGEYISFIDADDWIEKDSYELLCSRAKKHDLDILIFQMVNYINSSGKLVETDLYNYKSLLDNLDSNISFSSKDTKDFLFNIAVCPVSKLYKKSFLDEKNIKFPENMIFEDNIFFYNAFLEAEKISFIDKKLYYRRRHSESITQNISKKTLDIVLATNTILNLFKEKSWYGEYKNPLINHTFSMILEWFLKAKLILCEDFFIKIKEEFLGFNELKDDFKNNLNKKNLNIYNLFLKNDHYLDFITKYNYYLYKYDIGFDVKPSDYKISIIIPIYNNENIIHRTLMSIINQTFGFESIEVILVNDKSIDNTANVIDDYANKYDNIKSIHLKNNSGSAGMPRNIGIKESSSDYIMFLDHDDFFENNAIEILYDEILKENSDVVFGTYSVIHGEKFHDISFPNEKHGYFENIYFNERFVGFPPPSIWTKLFKKEFIIKNNILFSPYLGEDAIFMSKVFLNASGINYLWDTLICYHVLSKTSATNTISLKYLTEGLTSEKYLHMIFAEINKECYFKYRCEGNLDFFLSQFLKSNLDKNEIIEILPLFKWFVDKGNYFNLTPNNPDNNTLFNYFINEDVESIYKFKIELNNIKKKKKDKINLKNKTIQLIKNIVKKLINKILSKK